MVDVPRLVIAVLALLAKLAWDQLMTGWRGAAIVFTLMMALLWAALQVGLTRWYFLLVDFLTPSCSR